MEIPEKKVITKKQWTKPIVITLIAEELRKHIQAAARSGVSCGGVNAR